MSNDQMIVDSSIIATPIFFVSGADLMTPKFDVSKSTNTASIGAMLGVGIDQ